VSTITPSTSSSTATTAQTNVESGGGGPDYAGAYANNFTAANVAAQPTTGTTGSPAVTVTAAGSTVIAFDTVLNPAVVYGGMASVNTASNRIIIQGSGSFAEVCNMCLTCVTYLSLGCPSYAMPPGNSGNASWLHVTPCCNIFCCPSTLRLSVSKS